MKPVIKVRIKRTWELGTIKNCFKEDGEFYYYIRVKNHKGLTLVHESDIQIL